MNRLMVPVMVPVMMVLFGPSTAYSDAQAGVSPVSEPLWVENFSPPANAVALPPARSGWIEQGWQIDLHTAIASHWVMQSSANESLVLDGESKHVSLSAEYGFSERWAVRLTVPYVHQGGGFLDSAINHWHDVWGMPDGGRADYPSNRLLYQLESPSNANALTDTRKGWVGARTELSYGLVQTPDRAVSVTLGYQWPVGDDQLWQGGDEPSLYMNVQTSQPLSAPFRLTWHGYIGYTYAGESTLLGSAQRQHIARAGASIDWRFNSALSLIAQLDSHGPLADSELDALSDPALMLSFGARWYASPNWTLDASFVEDLVVEASPDIAFQATLRWYPQSR